MTKAKEKGKPNSYFITSVFILGVHFGCHYNPELHTPVQYAVQGCRDGTSKGAKAVFKQHSA